ncbi:MAG: alpha/beta fold hydrolase [Bacteroidota bacterium]|nr:alpha/beta fold hydrolase [Bacteroidota bacterium]MDP4205922.1 alpha/beta fold hydrolase [Bacteroidota bacterium]
MRDELKYTEVRNYTTFTGALYPRLELSYQIFGPGLDSSSPTVLVCHALTGNSKVTGEGGWWDGIIGPDKLIDTNYYTVIGINIPGNGYDQKPENLQPRYFDFTIRDIATLFVNVLKQIGVHQLDFAIGGSLGGGVCWELAVLFPDFVKTIIPVAADWKATDWIIAHNCVQLQILENSKDPLHDARMMAMMFYRTPASLKSKFNRAWNKERNMYNIESWLYHHGEKLKDRFTIEAYRLMTNLLSTLDITKGRGSFEDVAKRIKARIVIVGIDSDFFFVPEENHNTFYKLIELGKDADYLEIESIHGHDAFLIEFDQLTNLLFPIFDHKSEKRDETVTLDTINGI